MKLKCFKGLFVALSALSLTSCSVLSTTSTKTSDTKTTSDESIAETSTKTNETTDEATTSTNVISSTSNSNVSETVSSTSSSTKETPTSTSSSTSNSSSSEDFTTKSSTIESTSKETSSPSSSTSSKSTTSETQSSASDGTVSKDAKIEINKHESYSEGAYVDFVLIEGTKIDDYTVTYKKTSDSSYSDKNTIDRELINKSLTGYRADILGLSLGTYDIKVAVAINGEEKYSEINNVNVVSYDRSGYAHQYYSAYDGTSYDNTGVGAYKNDGTLKDNAVVVYVTDDTKNTVTAKIGGKSYTGLAAILQAQSKSSYPLDIRIIGTITTNTWNEIKYTSDPYGNKILVDSNGNLFTSDLYEADIISKGLNTLNTNYTKLNGLTNKIKVDISKNEYDSYYNMLDIKGAKNTTVEGVGQNAGIFQWGFTWKSDCVSIEVRNLDFKDYTEDACSFEGSKTSSTTMKGFTGGHIWVHDNTFQRGKNYWDVCSELDKADGDGATDFKGVAYVTISYNHYIKCHKTGLVGGGDSQTDANFTFHHNFYDECQARLPFARQANIHMYNNYYYKSTGNNMQIYAGCYAFIENCYFESTKKTFVFKEETVTSAIKSYNNTFNNCSNYDGATIVTDREEKVTNTNVFDQNFDTNSSIFYYDSTNKRSNVALMNKTDDVPSYVRNHSGSMSSSYTSNANDYQTHSYTSTNTNQEDKDTSDTTYTVDYTKLTWNIIENEDFSTSKTITNLSKNEIPSESGIYCYTDSADTSTNNISVKDESLLIYDSSTSTTYGYYLFSNKYSTGYAKYSMTFTPQTSNSKWVPITFLANTNIQIGTDTNKYLYVKINDITKTTSYVLTANKSYTISIIVDYENNKTIVSIDSNEFTFDVNVGPIKGIYLMTASTNSRSFTIDNIKVEYVSKENE